MAELDRRQFPVGAAGGAVRVLVPRDSTRIVYNPDFRFRFRQAIPPAR